MKRQEFIKKFAVGGSILFTAPALFNSCSKDETPDPEGEENPGNSNAIEVDLNHADFAALGAVGGYAYKGAIIVCRTSDTGYIALASACTHSGCTVTYDHGANQLPCPCHGSIFSTTGSVTNGPASSNLKSYNVAKEGNILKLT